MNGSSNGNGEEHGQPIDWIEDVDFWAGCKLTTTLTDPPRHELRLPTGQTLRVRTADFFDVRRFTMLYVDAVGSFPPLPEKKPGIFLRDAFKAWLASRAVVVFAEEEASDRGALVGDIRRAVSSCPETEDPRDLDRGALYRRSDGSVWVNARILLERVRRACPVKFPPADFYVALASLGAKNLEVQRDSGWRGRAWSIPAELLPEPELLPAQSATTSEPPGTGSGSVTEQGAFDGLIDP